MSKNNKKTYLFIDESGDPGKPYLIDNKGNKTATGASEYYIVSVIVVDNKRIYLIENEILKLKEKYKYQKEIKSTVIPLSLYRNLLKLINRFDINVYYRCIDKNRYKGVFAVKNKKHLNNVFDEYNLVKLVSFALRSEDLVNVEIVIDRADRRAHEQSFDNFNKYLYKKCNTDTIKRATCVTHVCSEYVNIMQLTDLVSGAIKNNFTKKDKDLIKIIDRKRIIKCI